MANIKLSPLLTEIKGKIGGTIFQNSQSGNTIRTSTKSVNVNSQLQVNIKNFTFILQQYWKNLSEVNRQEWHNLIKYNNVSQKNNKARHINSMQCFIKFNAYRLLYGYVYIKSPAFIKCGLDPINAEISLITNTLVLSLDRVIDDTNEFLVLFLSYMCSSGINNPSNRLRVIVFSPSSFEIVDIHNEYVNIFGEAPCPGNTIFLKYFLADKRSGMILPEINKKIEVDYIYALDSMLSDLEIAFSLYKVLSAYAGNCVKIQRASDSVEQDFGFVDNFVDIASIKTFLSGTTGRVSVWYDQSVNGNFASQSVFADMPDFNINGEIIFSGSQALQLNSNVNFADDTDYSIFYRSKIDPSHNQTWLRGDTASGFISRIRKTGLFIRYSSSVGETVNFAYNVTADNTSYFWTHFDGVIPNLSLSVDNSLVQSLTLVDSSFNIYNIGASSLTGTDGVYGTIYNLFAWSENLSSSNKYILNLCSKYK